MLPFQASSLSALIECFLNQLFALPDLSKLGRDDLVSYSLPGQFCRLFTIVMASRGGASALSQLDLP
jgi:hypothetical protein